MYLVHVGLSIKHIYIKLHNEKWKCSNIEINIIVTKRLLWTKIVCQIVCAFGEFVSCNDFLIEYNFYKFII